ncbi:MULTISPECIES: biosynthetic arginine decarboxylase [unclassified Wenzhouxiangella]|uniref:biosynthetic arginine decarboxylase n=1 Tax=unclassified Wenzhouxiangella TaxID=2613841 RepID=UPI000E325247|nr:MULTISPECIES: biosynthetic arginine decarboxylase [unclassified Wenzhouxiangella]RFF27390.1 biosynthetic arginine decarboxylase [Wenzhouxiangella sp. 15181]RFP68818.1 biosynthetic arginine decarboxylase [Wenzhouxiangella sp. 15190]
MNNDANARARRRYAVDRWSEGYFDLDDQGRLLALPDREHRLVLTEIVERARRDGLRLPMLLRFPDILRARAGQLRTAFDTAIAEHDYEGGYSPVYPIKVNQQASVVRTLAEIEGLGLEVGSKPELITALAVSRPGTLIICNGYKDAAYIRLALSGVKIGLKPLIVIEKPGEWPVIQREAKRLGVTPEVGVRLRLSSLGTGNWQNTGGERAKFGLAASQLLGLAESMRETGCLDWLTLLHFHMGSQISNLRDIQRGVREAGRYFTELVAAGVDIRRLDIGGGLGVDYEGGGTRSFCSMNYSVGQYAQAIVGGIAELCREHELAMPDLVSESGRALTAHHAVLVTNVTATETLPRDADAGSDDESAVIRGLAEVLSQVDEREPEESFLEAEHLLEEGRNLFLYGDLPLAERARLEPMYNAILDRVVAHLDPEHRRHRELGERIGYQLSAKYFINLSIFQSLPDIWAIDQVFPILPLNRLDKEPTERAVLEDLTCDSDGRIDRYVERGLLEPTLPVHRIEPDETYLLGIFMAGAYQETLGDIHNLFGDTDSIDVHIENGGFRLENARAGDSADRLLEMVGYNPQELVKACNARVAAAGLPREEADALERLLADGLSAYTYLDV